MKDQSESEKPVIQRENRLKEEVEIVKLNFPIKYLRKEEKNHKPEREANKQRKD